MNALIILVERTMLLQTKNYCTIQERYLCKDLILKAFAVFVYFCFLLRYNCGVSKNNVAIISIFINISLGDH